MNTAKFFFQARGGADLPTLYSLTVNGPSGWGTTYAWGLPYSTANGNWRLAFNFAGAKTTGNGASFSFSGVTFFTTGRQAVVAMDDSGGSAATNCFVDTGNKIQLSFAANQTAVTCSGDVALASKPTFVP